MGKKWIVVTTINPPSEAIRSISKLAAAGWSAVVVGDRKTPPGWSAPNIDYISTEDQAKLYGDLSGLVPHNHYCRKNLGYLYAISRGAEWILETDDDNIPYPEFGSDIRLRHSARMVHGTRWVNVYKHFTAAHIWPRGLPLDEIASAGMLGEHAAEASFPIQQYLADLDPDVDAVYRLVVGKDVIFDRNPTVGLESGCWVPFNSQNTLFHRDAFPLLYLPCHVSFRMTDIWRSFVAQQALWISGHRLAFHRATVKQLRNEHNLMRDFADEIPGYLDNKRIIDVLEKRAASIPPSAGLTAAARELWEALNVAGIIPDVEMKVLDAWMGALGTAMTGGRQ